MQWIQLMRHSQVCSAYTLSIPPFHLPSFYSVACMGMGRSIKAFTTIPSVRQLKLLCMILLSPYIGAFYYILGNVRPQLRSKISNIQLLLLAKYDSVVEFGIDRMLEPTVEDIRKLESVSYNAKPKCMHAYVWHNFIA